ncbi:MAG: hypothetical protein R2849_14550 [Thermomicrobiales bacterium]
MVDPRLFDSLEWRSIGPHRGGRVVAVAGHPTEVGTFYFGACAGGVWKTTNGGSHWRNISDGFFNTAAIGALAVSQSDPNVIYAGTGEVTIRSNVSHGDGVYKSTDGGRTWANMGLAATRHIGDVVIHPNDPDTVYVAALGNAFAENPERGVFRSTDGGESWSKVLYKSDRAGSPDIAMDGGNPRILYASILQARRYHHTLQSGGEDCGLWRSTDGGDTWQEITRNSGLPQEGLVGKIGIATTAARPGRVWAIVEHEDGAVFRSDDYGDTWKKLADSPDLRRRPWYYMHLVADPNDADTLWNLNVQFWKSIDGGESFTSVAIPMATTTRCGSTRRLEPDDQGNDGGACVSYDGGKSWSSILNQPTAQFYHVTTDHRTPYNVYGSQQDNWAMMVPSIGFEGAITWKDYVEPGGGESGYIAIKPEEPYTVWRRHRYRSRRWTPALLEPEHPAGPQRHRLAGGVRLWRLPPEVPLPVDLPDRDLAPRPGHRLRLLPARAQVDRRGHQLGSHQPRPDTQRPRQAPGVGGRSPPSAAQPRCTATSSPSASLLIVRASSGPAATMGWSISRRTAARTGRTSRPVMT